MNALLLAPSITVFWLLVDPMQAPRPLTTCDPDHPSLIACYGLADTPMMVG